MKVVINKCYGGFGLSSDAVKYLIEKDSPLIKKMTYSEYTGGRHESLTDDEFYANRMKPVGDGFYSDGFIESVLYDESGTKVWNDQSDDKENRIHPDLIEVVELMKDKSSGRFAKLEIVEIPDGVEYEIEEYDGIEWIAESHRTWG